MSRTPTWIFCVQVFPASDELDHSFYPSMLGPGQSQYASNMIPMGAVRIPQSFTPEVKRRRPYTHLACTQCKEKHQKVHSINVTNSLIRSVMD
jgi:hypothetical protein